MKLGDVKVGEKYYTWNADYPLVADEIERADRKNGIMHTTILCTNTGTGEQKSHHPCNLTPWDEHLAQERMLELEKEEAEQYFEAIRDALGGEEEVLGEVGVMNMRLSLTEQAADKLLEICGANPLPDDRRPSRAVSDAEWERRCVLLGRRLRRAIGVGYSGDWLPHSFSPDKPYVASVFFMGKSPALAAERIAGLTSDEPSPLSELLV